MSQLTQLELPLMVALLNTQIDNTTTVVVFLQFLHNIKIPLIDL